MSTRTISDERAAGMLATVTRDGERDRVAVEEPLEIRVDGTPLTVTMRTPGHDEELALGFLYGEALIDRAHAVGLTADFARNTIEAAGPLLRDPGARRFYTTSSCGVCGKGALDEVAVRAPAAPPGPGVTRALLASLPDRLREPAFDGTGGLSSELVQKAAVAGAPILVGVGAPTSLAFELAADRGLTLAGFARNGRINV